MRLSAVQKSSFLLAAALMTCNTQTVIAQAPPGAPPAGGGFGPNLATLNYTPAIYIDSTGFRADKSVAAALVSGDVKNNAASNVVIKSATDKLTGIYINGADYTVSDSTITLTGNAGPQDDVTGLGAGVMVAGGGSLTLRNVHITTNGLRSVTASNANGTLKVYDSTLISNGADVPYENTVVGSGPGYVGPPEPLGIRGNARGTNVFGNAKAYYYNSTIIAKGWGAMSTDAATPDVYLEVNDSIVKVLDSGYGTYADNGCKVVFNNTKSESATYTGIISGSGKIYLNNVTETKAINGVMLHAPGQDFVRVATLELKGGSFRTQEAVVLVKSHNADIVIDGVQLLPRNGEILRSVINDSKRSAILRWLNSADKSRPPVTGPVTGIRATLRNMTMKGNIVHADTMRNMALTLEALKWTGALLGSIYTVTDVSISMGAGSSWKATADSRVTLLNATDAKVFDAARGVTITAIAGAGTTLSGKYMLASGGLLNVKKAG